MRKGNVFQVLGGAALVGLMLLGAGAFRTAAQTATVDAPRALVLVDTNLRSSPGMAGMIVGRAAAGEEYLVRDQAQQCAWLQVVALEAGPEEPSGWISGNPAYVELTVPCEEIGVSVPAPSQAPSTPNVASQATPGDVSIGVVILIDGTPIRTAPGASARIARTAAAGEELSAFGQVDACKWLHVVDANGEIGWVTGNLAYSELMGGCDVLPNHAPPTPTPEPVPQLTVLLENVNIRASASTQSRVIRTAALEERFEVAGQTGECKWYQIVLDSEGEVGWISGNPAYTEVDQPCVRLTAIAPTPTPRPSPTAVRTVQGCATVTNLLGFTVRIDITRNDGWKTSFSLAPEASRYACVDAGTYIATLSSPSRSDRFSVPLYVRGGENYSIPLRLP